ncbi:nucleoside deaminase [Candidatus Wolfebacteria bacterium]|nr:nucleoside deaminase [Candidatus Wolfebacteria bacterium]
MDFKYYKKYIKRCIRIAEYALDSGELPHGSIIVKNNKIISEAGNQVRKDRNILQHAEIVALIKAQKILSLNELKKCTIYSTFEPCPMCAFAIRELKLKKVVFSIPSPIMGGYSKWDILQDGELNKKFPKYFGAPPKIIKKVLRDEALKTWKKREILKENGLAI